MVWSEAGHSFHQMLRLRMSRSVPLHPFYAFLVLTAATLTFLPTADCTPKKFSRCCLQYAMLLSTCTFLTGKMHCFVTVGLCVCVLCRMAVIYLLFNVTAADPNAWRLGRIEEGDHETPVWNEMWSTWTSDWWCWRVITKTVCVRTEFKYNTQDDDSLSQSLSLPYNSSKMSLHYV